jgi:adenosine deaminase
MECWLVGPNYTITAHAGENDDAEGIWQAVFKLHARRLGHALHLAQAPDLYRTVVERRIGVEMCPFANYQIRGFLQCQIGLATRCSITSGKVLR